MFGRRVIMFSKRPKWIKQGVSYTTTSNSEIMQKIMEIVSKNGCRLVDYSLYGAFQKSTIIIKGSKSNTLKVKIAMATDLSESIEDIRLD